MLARETRKKNEGFHHQEAFYETLDEKASPESLFVRTLPQAARADCPFHLYVMQYIY